MPGRHLVVLVPLVMACTKGIDRTPEELVALLACNDEAVGGPALRSLQRVEYDLTITEPGFVAQATYSADRREGARIDVYQDGQRVFSEGWDGARGWQLTLGASDPTPTSEAGAAALRHGLEQPGHLWTLDDMARNGHTVEWAPEPGLRGETKPVVRLTLADGAQVWYWLDPESCMIVRSRGFAALHPDLDPEQRWIQTEGADFRRSDGVTRAWVSSQIDAVTGDTLGVTRVEAVRSR